MVVLESMILNSAETNLAPVHSCLDLKSLNVSPRNDSYSSPGDDPPCSADLKRFKCVDGATGVSPPPPPPEATVKAATSRKKTALDDPIAGDDEEFLFIDEDDRDFESLLDQPTQPKRATVTTAIAFESSDGHFDVTNSLHKERPLRVTAIKDFLKKSGILTSSGILVIVDRDRDNGVVIDDKDVNSVHQEFYVQRILNCCGGGSAAKMSIEASQYKSIYLTDYSFVSAKRAASSLCSVTRAVLENQADNGFAVIRPPGHHAEPSCAGGYCVLNNVAIAANYARKLSASSLQSKIKKIAIVDWDVHHGNGTQKIFYEDKNTLYISVHRFHNGGFFPFLPDGGAQNVGGSASRGSNVNIAWNEKHLGDDEYYAAFDCVVFPILKEFAPDLILVSAGFDAAAGDMGETLVTPQCFRDLTADLLNVQSRVVMALEGGYVRSVLADCVAACVQALKVGPTKTLEEVETANKSFLNGDVKGKFAEVLGSIRGGARASIER